MGMKLMKPTGHLLTLTDYSLSLLNLCDYSGNAFSATGLVSFTTGSSAVADTTRPTVVSITPL